MLPVETLARREGLLSFFSRAPAAGHSGARVGCPDVEAPKDAFDRLS
jgi:hypothetical protein